ncbi:MAG: GNAT family N-acetyltransferase [Clostridiales bacterium]|jgi:ribosomal-protein-alanine N-acetyltransferase|nr:GNAT family N-acetyltransferase [Clostridiales bacterium]
MQYTCETDRLLLKVLGKEAAWSVLNFYDENRTHFEPWEPKRPDNFYTISYQRASLTAEYHQMAEGKLLRYWVFLKDQPDEIIGSVCFQNFLRAPYMSCCLGYKFSRRYTHKGYALESIRKGIDIIWSDYSMHRIEAYIMPNNRASLQLIERLHFIYEGICYSYANIDGVWSDHKRYALLNPSG